MKRIGKAQSAVVSLVVVAVALAAPAVSNANELQLGSPGSGAVVTGTALALKSNLVEVRPQFYSPTKCTGLKAVTKVTKNIHSEPFKGADYGLFETVSETERPAQVCENPTGHERVSIERVVVNLEPGSAAGANGPVGSLHKGFAQVQLLVNYLPGGNGVVCGMSGKLASSYRSGSNSITLTTGPNTGEKLNHNPGDLGQGCGAAIFSGTFDVATLTPPGSQIPIILR